jgi:uncharacterized protein YjiS (DUF1127 family)
MRVARSRSASPRPGHLLGLLWNLPAAGLGLLATWQQRVRDRRLLLSLDDHTLKDIGLSRADIAREAGKPFWRA